MAHHETTSDALRLVGSNPVLASDLVERIGLAVRDLDDDHLRRIEWAARLARGTNRPEDFGGVRVAALDDATPEELREIVGALQQLADITTRSIAYVGEYLEARSLAGAADLAEVHQELWNATVKLNSVTAGVGVPTP